MTNRNPVLVVILSLVTCGLYYIYWLVSTKSEMKKLGAEIPTALLIIIPLANIYWFWCWSQGVEKVTKGGLTAVPVFLLMCLLPIAGAPISQSYFNKISPA